MSGKNPFLQTPEERKETLRKLSPRRSPGLQEGRSVWEQMREAREQAQRQRQLTAAALQAEEAQPETLKEETETPAPSSGKTSGSEVRRSPSSPRICLGICLLIWLIPSLLAIWANPIGGALVSLLWLWVCLIAIRLPYYASGAFSDGGRNNRGAAV